MGSFHTHPSSLQDWGGKPLSHLSLLQLKSDSQTLFPSKNRGVFRVTSNEKLVWLHLDDWVQFSSVAQLCPTLCNPMNCSTPGLPVHHQLPESTQTHIHCVGNAIQPSHCCPLLFPPSIFPSIRVFSNESALHIRWPKYWSFSFSIGPSKEHPGLISFRWTGWISLQSKGLSSVFSNTTVQKHQFFCAQLSLESNSHIHT